jgi:hypothetical protein
MAANHLAQIRKITPSDTAILTKEFNYIQCGGSGDIAVAMGDETPVVISSSLTDKMSIVPVGTINRVMATDTTATDIYVW